MFLSSHLAFHALGLGAGVCSPVRGLVRTREHYYARLNNADLPRRNDLDRRGRHSQEEFVAFPRYFLETKERLRVLLLHLQQAPWQICSERPVVKIEALEALYYVTMVEPIERSRFIAMTGLGERTGLRILASLLDFGVLAAGSPRGPVALALPLSALAFLHANLWPEVEID